MMIEDERPKLGNEKICVNNKSEQFVSVSHLKTAEIASGTIQKLYTMGPCMMGQNDLQYIFLSVIFIFF